jgi:hypothetical protein
MMSLSRAVDHTPLIPAKVWRSNCFAIESMAANTELLAKTGSPRSRGRAEDEEADSTSTHPALMDVRFGAECGLKSDIARGPKSAKCGCRGRARSSPLELYEQTLAGPAPSPKPDSPTTATRDEDFALPLNKFFGAEHPPDPERAIAALDAGHDF